MASKTDSSAIEPFICALRGQKVILDSDLARLYAVETKRLNEQLRRNKKRFPKDFVFQISAASIENICRLYLRSTARCRQRTFSTARKPRP